MTPEVVQVLVDTFDVERHLVVFLLVAARWLPLVVLAPIFAARAMPASARVGVAFAFTLLVFPAAYAARGDLPRGTVELTLLVLREGLVGALLGLLVAIPFYALEGAGRLIDTARGAGMAELLAAPTGTRTTPTGAFLLLLGVVLFLAVDGHLLVIQAVGESYRTLPAGATLPADAPARVVPLALHLGGQLFAVALGIAAPVLVAAVLVDLSLGLAARLAPRLPLYFLGLPVKALAAVAVLLLSLTVMLWSLGALYRMMLRALEVALRILTG
ncbi:MAG: flagellar biosynthetic protein FliR [bacterium]